MGEYNKNPGSLPDENPDDWNILKQAKVKLPAMVDFTCVIFYGNY